MGKIYFFVNIDNTAPSKGAKNPYGVFNNEIMSGSEDVIHLKIHKVKNTFYFDESFKSLLKKCSGSKQITSEFCQSYINNFKNHQLVKAKLGSNQGLDKSIVCVYLNYDGFDKDPSKNKNKSEAEDKAKAYEIASFINSFVKEAKKKDKNMETVVFMQGCGTGGFTCYRLLDYLDHFQKSTDVEKHKYLKNTKVSFGAPKAKNSLFDMLNMESSKEGKPGLNAFESKGQLTIRASNIFESKGDSPINFKKRSNSGVSTPLADAEFHIFTINPTNWLGWEILQRPFGAENSTRVKSVTSAKIKNNDPFYCPTAGVFENENTTVSSDWTIQTIFTAEGSSASNIVFALNHFALLFKSIFVYNLKEINKSYMMGLSKCTSLQVTELKGNNNGLKSWKDLIISFRKLFPLSKKRSFSSPLKK